MFPVGFVYFSSKSLNSTELRIILQGGYSNTSEFLVNQTEYETKLYDQNFILNMLGGILAMQKNVIWILSWLNTQVTGLETEAQGWLREVHETWCHNAAF